MNGAVLGLLVLILAYLVNRSASSPAPSTAGDGLLNLSFPPAADLADTYNSVFGDISDSADSVIGSIQDTVSSVLDSGLNAVIGTIADAIQQHEGFIPAGSNPSYPTGSRSWRNNNPGNLRVDGDLQPARDPQGFGRFNTYEAGRAALESDIRAKIRKYPNFSIYDMIARYAPPSENDTTTYANIIAGALGVPVTTKLQDLAS